MTFGQAPTDRQAKAQAAEPLRDRLVALVEGVKNLRERRGLDTDSGVGHLDDQGITLVAASDDDPPAARGELHGVLDQVPGHLLKPGRVGVDEVAGGVEVDLQAEPGLVDPRPADLDGFEDQAVGVDDASMESELALDDPVEVEQVVDQVGFDLDVPPSHLQE